MFRFPSRFIKGHKTERSETVDPVRRRATISERTFSRRAKRITEAALLFTLPFLGGAMANLSIGPASVHA